MKHKPIMKNSAFQRSYLESGDDLLSRAVTSQVPSALKGLTSVFGMGTGVTPSSLSPEMVSCFVTSDWNTFQSHSSLYRNDRSARSSFSSSSRTPRIAYATLTTAQHMIQFTDRSLLISFSRVKSSPRPISIIKLHTLPYFHR